MGQLMQKIKGGKYFTWKDLLQTMESPKIEPCVPSVLKVIAYRGVYYSEDANWSSSY